MSSPAASPSSPTPGRFTEPVTPKNTTVPSFNETPDHNDQSPTSTLSGESISTSTLLSSSALRLNDTNRPLFRSMGPAPQRSLVRADSSMLTCFDPSDKELYDLWAPRS